MTNNEFSELLDKKLAGVATKKDVEGLKGDVGLLKNDVGLLKNDLKNLELRFGFKLLQLEQRFEEKLEDKFSKYVNIVLDKFDKVMGELKIRREERIFQQAQINRIKEHIGLEV